ncbi:hypothetical protein [Dendronalium sp. ChiSLP03b]|uniref:hypothetical protein n=1 Tax=Dendronalium sp. ChiSLP03b TaxID=3075381 RepID=UPI002AD20317|nr:hypothetical protein [Dendronalium sp. ChiSLP03b]MDZ8207582.1 hypothetical protein [Dendronalium sp. ChiSLP03b]
MAIYPQLHYCRQLCDRFSDSMGDRAFCEDIQNLLPLQNYQLFKNCIFFGFIKQHLLDQSA